MYIGPWQEFRLAKVIEIKQRLASKDDELAKLRVTLQQLQDENRALAGDRVTPLGRKRQDSFASDRNSVYSEPLMNRAPTFKTDDCYRNLEKIDGNLTREQFLDTAFPDTALYQRPINKSYGLPPKIGGLRKKKTGTKTVFQQKQERLNKMREIFGINRQGSEVPSEAGTDLTDDRMSQYSVSTNASTKTAPLTTHFPQLRNFSEPRKQQHFEISASKNNFSYFPKLGSTTSSVTTASSSRTSASSTRRGKSKGRSSKKKDQKKRSASQRNSTVGSLLESRFSSHQNAGFTDKIPANDAERLDTEEEKSQPVDDKVPVLAVEEDNWETGVDNLLNWVEELPEELSTDSTHIANAINAVAGASSKTSSSPSKDATKV